MTWNDIACIVFICVTANHLGLISKMEEICGRSIPVMNCPKCFTFWSVLLYGLFNIYAVREIITVFAVSFLSSYAALWMELFEAFIDNIYIIIYGKITAKHIADETATDAGNVDSASTVPDLQ